MQQGRFLLNGRAAKEFSKAQLRNRSFFLYQRHTTNRGFQALPIRTAHADLRCLQSVSLARISRLASSRKAGKFS